MKINAFLEDEWNTARGKNQPETLRKKMVLKPQRDEIWPSSCFVKGYSKLPSREISNLIILYLQGRGQNLFCTAKKRRK